MADDPVGYRRTATATPVCLGCDHATSLHRFPPPQLGSNAVYLPIGESVRPAPRAIDISLHGTARIMLLARRRTPRALHVPTYDR